jgi:hypothetical protein
MPSSNWRAVRVEAFSTIQVVKVVVTGGTSTRLVAKTWPMRLIVAAHRTRAAIRANATDGFLHD